jgi:hypothetical protein
MVCFGPGENSPEISDFQLPWQLSLHGFVMGWSRFGHLRKQLAAGGMGRVRLILK